MVTTVKNVSRWIASNLLIIGIFLAIILLNIAYYLIPKGGFNGTFEKGIQNHLVWSVNNECYFVKPLNTTDVLLVRLSDCDKTETRGR